MSESFKKTRPNEMRLIPLKPKSNYKSEIVYNFERINHKKEREVDLPVLNFDSPAWFPGIIAPHERSGVENNSKLYKESFFAKVNKEDEEEVGQLILPKPPKKATFCGVCDKFYEEYYAHVNSDEHQNKFRNNSFLEVILNETRIIQEEFQNHLLNEVNFEEISCKESVVPESATKNLFSEVTGIGKERQGSGLKDDHESQREYRFTKLANKENDETATSDRKKKKTVRKISPVFFEDYKELNETTTDTGRQNQGLGRKIQVQKVFNLPTTTTTQTEKMIFSGEKNQHILEEETKGNHGNTSLRTWMFSPQESVKNSQNALLGFSTDVEQRESTNRRSTRSIKRKYPTFTESDQEVLNSFKKVKITDDSIIQEERKMVQIPVNLVRGAFNYIVNTLAGQLGSLKGRLLDQFGVKA